MYEDVCVVCEEMCVMMLKSVILNDDGEFILVKMVEKDVLMSEEE